MFKVIAAVFLSFLTTTAVFADEAFFLADDADSAPYVWDENKKAVGIFADIMKEAFRRMKVPLKHEVYPWTRAQNIVKEKQADALLTTPTPERLKYLVPSQEIVFVMKYKTFTQRDNPQVDKIKNLKSLNDLKGLKIVDYIGDGWAKKHLAQFDSEIDWSTNLTAACVKIAANRGDVFVQDEMMVLHAIKNYKDKGGDPNVKFDRVVAFDAPVAEVKFHLLVHKDSKFLSVLPKFDEAIREMRKSGEIERITNKWVK